MIRYNIITYYPEYCNIIWNIAKKADTPPFFSQIDLDNRSDFLIFQYIQKSDLAVALLYLSLIFIRFVLSLKPSRC